ncbi:hypothetical protein HRG_010444 [Hirsutella rhossiliensis]|uniref:Uncharacterized protein n=1 Tax=Hirsutella rhossiliensis TaxID=111463 RepID=A0A9P8MNY9_9HYPO|nr:uncharacterized protein HRG_10444 [Hirsutella rhossiliensis]KAH0958757.1 hypothetical protein HRG_10444 [Hirsutella rhossiliensis]
MRLLGALVVVRGLALASQALASQDLQPASDTKKGLLVLQQDRTNSDKSLEIWNREHKRLYYRSCSQTMDRGGFDRYKYPISFAVDSDGVGNVTVGPRSYRVSEDPEYSGGIRCTRMHSSKESLVVCKIDLPLALQPNEAEDFPSCHRNGQLDLWSVYEAKRFKTLSLPASPNQTVNGSWCSLSGKTSRGPNPDPRQTPVHVQLSENTHCGTGKCAIAPGSYKSHTVYWSAVGSVPFGWTDAYLRVQPTVETGNEHKCEGEPGDVVCVWKKQGQTSYAVIDIHDTCGKRWHTMGYTMRSPNMWHSVGYYYCAYGRDKCRHEGARVLDVGDSHSPGNPPYPPSHQPTMVQRNHVIAIIIIVLFVILALVSFGIWKLVHTARKDLSVTTASSGSSSSSQGLVDDD